MKIWSLALIQVQLLCMYVSAIDLSEYIGMGVSTAWQSSPIPPATVGNIARHLNVKTFRLFESDTSPQIAEQIVAQSSTPSEIKFIIAFWDVNNVTASRMKHTLSKFGSVRSNVWCITFGNEPDLTYWPAFDTLADKLKIMYKYLASTKHWKHVKVTIPFSGAIFGNESHFQDKWALDLKKVLRILQKYDGPFSMNMYTFFDLIYGPNEFNEERLAYALGRVKGKLYDSKLEELYDRAKQAIYNTIGENDIDLILTEAGFPTDSDKYTFATVSNAKEYVKNMLKAMNNSQSVLYQKKVVLFELFDENGKGGFHTDVSLTEKHWGLYQRQLCLKYYVDDLFRYNATQELCASATSSLWWSWKETIILIVAVLVVFLLSSMVYVFYWRRKRRNDHQLVSEDYEPPLVQSQ